LYEFIRDVKGFFSSIYMNIMYMVWNIGLFVPYLFHSIIRN